MNLWKFWGHLLSFQETYSIQFLLLWLKSCFQEMHWHWITLYVRQRLLFQCHLITLKKKKSICLHTCLLHHNFVSNAIVRGWYWFLHPSLSPRPTLCWWICQTQEISICPDRSDKINWRLRTFSLSQHDVCTVLSCHSHQIHSLSLCQRHQIHKQACHRLGLSQGFVQEPYVDVIGVDVVGVRVPIQQLQSHSWVIIWRKERRKKWQ